MPVSAIGARKKAMDSGCEGVVGGKEGRGSRFSQSSHSRRVSNFRGPDERRVEPWKKTAPKSTQVSASHWLLVEKASAGDFCAGKRQRRGVRYVPTLPHWLWLSAAVDVRYSTRLSLAPVPGFSARLRRKIHGHPKGAVSRLSRHTFRTRVRA